MKRGFGVEGAEAPVLSDIGPGPATPFPAMGLLKPQSQTQIRI